MNVVVKPSPTIISSPKPESDCYFFEAEDPRIATIKSQIDSVRHP
jgi:hypothetical protein